MHLFFYDGVVTPKTDSLRPIDGPFSAGFSMLHCPIYFALFLPSSAVRYSTFFAGLVCSEDETDSDSFMYRASQ